MNIIHFFVVVVKGFCNKNTIFCKIFLLAHDMLCRNMANGRTRSRFRTFARGEYSAEKPSKIYAEQVVMKMLKGCQKQMVVLRGKSGDIFEEAYFILRAGAGASGLPEMLCEANRIVEATKPCREKKNGVPSHVKSFIFFVVGIAVGAGLVLLSVSVA